jgi:hypothetical protein
MKSNWREAGDSIGGVGDYVEHLEKAGRLQKLEDKR